MKTTEEIDAIAWETIRNKPKLVLANARGSRPLDYAEMEAQLQAGVEFEHAWSNFLHAFFDYKDASFFVYPSPPSLDVEWQCVLAGAAEWLSAEFGLPHPEWTDEPKYFLAEPWDAWQTYGLALPENVEKNVAESPEAFRKRNVAFESRNLITL